MNSYQKDIEQVLTDFNTSLQGLTLEQIKKKQHEFGFNELPAEEQVSVLQIIVRQFANPLIYILIIAGIISFAAYKPADGVFICCAILLNVILGTYQEWRAEQSSQALKKLIKINARVKRNNREEIIEAKYLVPGDVVLLDAGMRIPADIRLVETNNLYVDESLLTGESKHIPKNATLLNQEVPITQQTNMLFAGSTVGKGKALGVVVKTGIKTELGKIAKTVAQAQEQKTPLLIRLDHFSKNISIATIFLTLLVFMAGILQGHSYMDIFFLSIALLVSAIPEGLPIAVTVALARGAYRMAQEKVIVRRLSAVEALGSCSCIASDKTGTLTINKQTIARIVLPSQEYYSVTGIGYNNEGSLKDQSGKPIETPPAQICALATIGIVCNEAYLEQIDNEWKYHGDDVDLAFQALGYKLGIDPLSFTKQYVTHEVIPFNEELRYTAKSFSLQNKTLIGIKGAAESVLPLCKTMQVGSENTSLDFHIIEKLIDELSSQGYRVLVIAQAEIQEKQIPSLKLDINKTPFTLLGIVGMTDPLRPEAIESVEKAKQAGLQVIMITGDHPKTAFTIARNLNLADKEVDVMTGDQLDATLKKDDPVKPFEFLKNVKVFARVMPLQKLAIVQMRKNLGDFVAVTGDGVNDAPALKEAHLGIAMGSGTDIAKEAASTIITDDNFASIVSGIKEGRVAYANIRKVIFLLISAGLAEILFILFSIILQLPAPLTAIQILWLNLVTNGIQDISLAFEPGEPFLLKGKFYNPDDGVFDKHMIEQVLLTGFCMAIFTTGLWFMLLKMGHSEFYARNYTFLFFIVMQNYHVINCKSEYTSIFKVGFTSNKFLLVGVVGAHLLHIICMYIPIMSKILQIEPVSLQGWAYIVLSASVIFIVNEIFKFFRRRARSL